MDREDTNFQSVTNENSLDTTHEFEIDETNFAISFGLIDSEFGFVLPEDHAQYVNWVVNIDAEGDGDDSDDLIPLSFHACSESDIEKYFFNADEVDMKQFASKVNCLDQPELVKFVASSDFGGLRFRLNLVRCEPPADCKP